MKKFYVEFILVLLFIFVSIFSYTKSNAEVIPPSVNLLQSSVLGTVAGRTIIRITDPTILGTCYLSLGSSDSLSCLP